MREKVKNNLTDKPKVTYSNSMPEDLDSKDRSVPETGSQSLASPNQSVEDAFSSFDNEFKNVLSAKLKKIAEENSKKEPQKEDTEKAKEATKSDTDKKDVEESPEDIEAKLTKKEKRLVNRIVKALDPTQKASFFNRLKFALKGSAYEDLSEVVKEEEMLKSDYKPKTVKEIGNPESFKRFVGNGGGMRDQYDTYVNGLVRRLRDEGIDDEKVLEVRKHAETDYAQNIQKIKKVLEETGDYKKVRTKLSQLGGNFNRFDTYIDHLKHDDIVDPVIYQDLAKPLEELPEVPQEIVVEKVSQEDSPENNIEATNASVEETKIKDVSVSADVQDEQQDKDQPEANGKFKIDPEVVKENAMLADDDRIKKASEVLGIQPEDLTAEQQQAILQAHYIGVGEKGKDRKEKGEETDAHIYNYTQAQLKEKSKILKSAHFSADQRRVLMEHGITGGEYGNESVMDLYNRAQGIETPQSSTSGSMFRDENGKLKSPDAITADGQLVIQRAVGKTYEDDINALPTQQADFETGEGTETYALQGILGSPDTFNFKMVRREINQDLKRLHKLAGTDRDVAQTIGQIGALLIPLGQHQQEAERIESELENLRFQDSQGANVQDQYRDLLVQKDRVRRSGWELARQAVDHLGNSYGKQRELYLDTSGGTTGGDSVAAPVRAGNEFGLYGRTESEGDEEALYGKSVSSIEDIGIYMEKLVAEYEGKIMASLYRVEKDGQIQVISEDDSYWDQFQTEEAKKAEREKSRLYAFNLGKDEYARDINKRDPDNLPEYYRELPGDRGNRVLMLTVDEIHKQYKHPEGSDAGAFTNKDERGVISLKTRDEQASIATDGRSQRKQIPTHYWEEVKVIKPDQYMNWMRTYWDYLHNDDPDNPANFFQGVIVNHPDQRGQVNAEMMHKAAGTYLRSKFLTDPTTGDRRVFNQLKNEIVNEMWVPSTERNNEVLYKKIMHADEKLPEVVRDQIVAGNLLAKNAAGGRNTLATFFTLPENFHDNFDQLTGETLEDSDREKVKDVRLGQAILLAYQMYYNIGDYDGMVNLLGKEASIFNRDSIIRAALQEKGEYAPTELTDTERGKAIEYLRGIDPTATILEDKYYDLATGRVKDKDSAGYDPEQFKKWMEFMNPFYPVQKDTKMLAVIRRMVRNQMQEIVRLKSNDGLAELHAYLRTYHDGLAARHDTGMGNRNAQSKYEFIEAYQDKQNKRDRSGNKYNKGIVKRTIVGMLHGMPTRTGETVQDILGNAVNIQLDGARGENGQKLVGALEYVNLLNEKKKEHKESVSRYRMSIHDMLDVEEISGDIDGISLTGEIREKIHTLKSAKKKYDDTLKKPNEVKVAWNQSKDTMTEEIVELLLREKDSSLKEKWVAYEDDKIALTKKITNTLDRLEFDEAQYTQYGGMHYSNGTAMFLEEMESHDLPLDEIRGRDYEGRVFFKTEKFGPWLESTEKRMRYTIETWPLPLGAMERRLVNPKSDKDEPPQYVDMPIIESIFGSKDSDVMKMVQISTYRYVEAKNKEREKKIKDAEKDLRKNKISQEEYDVIVEKNRKKLNKLDFTFCDKSGSIAELDEEGNVVYNSPVADKLRNNLRRLVGYIDYEEENGRKKGIREKHNPLMDDPATYFTKAYVKVRIANFLKSHTDKKTPYEKWTVAQREDFLKSLTLTNYFSEDDVKDIRNFSNNGYWKNLGAEARKNTRKALPEMFTGFFKEFSSIFKD